MMKKLFENTDLLAGVFAGIAIVAIVCEIAFGGFSKESIVGGIKDIAGVLVDFFVLIIAASVFVKRKEKNIVNILENSIKKWGDDNLPLIFKVEGFKQAQGSDYTQGFALLQNPREYIKVLKMNLNENHPEWSKYASYSSGITGKFIDMPSLESMTNGKFDVCVVMTQAHFKNMPGFDRTFDGIIDCINSNSNFNDVVKAYPVGNDFKLKLVFDKEIKTRADVDKFIGILDYIVSLVKIVA